jgi:hypothetical protein
MAVRHAFEFHDATLHSIRVNGPDAVLAMTVCVHASEGEPGVDSGSSWFQNAEVLVSGFTLVEGVAGESLDWDAYDGSIVLDGEAFSMVPVPFQKTGRIRVELAGVQGEKLIATGSAISIAVTGQPGPVEQF